MKNKIVSVIIISLIIFGIILIYFLSTKKTAEKTDGGGKVSTRIPAVPKITTYYPKNEGMEYTFSMDTFETPETLPLIRLAPPKVMTQNEVLEIAEKAGFGQEFTNFVNGQGQRVYLFRNDNSNLTVFADTAALSYRTYGSVPNFNQTLNTEEMAELAKQFLISKFPFNEDQLNLSFIAKYENEEYENPNIPNQPENYYEVNFSPVSTEYKVLTTNPEQSPTKVSVTENGVIGKADVTLVQQAEISSEVYRIKNFEDIKNEIDQAVTVQIYNQDDYGTSFLPDSITAIQIEEIEVFYLMDSPTQSRYFQPYFLLKGTGRSSSVSYPIKITLYLPALKN